MPVTPRTTSVIEREVRIEASPETVFGFFTDPEKMVRWMGIAATLDPRAGGVFGLSVNVRYFVEGEYVQVEPVSRVVFTWGFRDPPGSDNPLPPGASTVEVVLVPDGDATVVRLTHRDLPPETQNFHELGWEHYLARLVIVGEGGDPGPDPAQDVVVMLSDEPDAEETSRPPRPSG